MFQKLLVPLDGSTRAEQALPVAARIARASGASVVLLQIVIIPIDYGSYMASSPSYIEEIIGADMNETTSYLEGIARSDTLAGIKTDIKALIGATAPTILAVAQSIQADLIVMCSHGRTGMMRWALGSVAMKVVRSSTVPVLVLRDGGTMPCSAYPDMTRPLHAMAAVVALDGSTLAEAALLPAANLVAALAAPAQGSLHLTRVVPPPQNAKRSGQEVTDPLVKEQAITAAGSYLSKKAGELCERLEADFNLAVTWSLVVDSDVAEGLIGVAEEGKVTRGAGIFGGCDILALATHGRSGLQRWAMGSVTERVLGTTKLPLLVVRPEEERLRSTTAELPQEEIKKEESREKNTAR